MEPLLLAGGVSVFVLILGGIVWSRQDRQTRLHDRIICELHAIQPATPAGRVTVAADYLRLCAVYRITPSIHACLMLLEGGL